jgi:hypothetical protein
VKEDWPQSKTEFREWPSTKLGLVKDLCRKYARHNVAIADWHTATTALAPETAPPLAAASAATLDAAHQISSWTLLPPLPVFKWDTKTAAIVLDNDHPLPPQPKEVLTRPVKIVIYSHFVFLHQTIINVRSFAAALAAEGSLPSSRSWLPLAFRCFQSMARCPPINGPRCWRHSVPA